MKTSFCKRDLKILPDDKRLIQEVYWTSAYSKTALTYMLAGLFSQTPLPCCLWSLGQAISAGRFFILQRFFLKFTRCLVIHSHQNGWSSWHPSWPWPWFLLFASQSIVGEGKGRDYSLWEGIIEKRLCLLAVQSAAQRKSSLSTLAACWEDTIPDPTSGLQSQRLEC